MKRVMTAALVLTMLSGTSAFAQDRGEARRDHSVERRQDAREVRQDRREDRRENRQERRQERRDDRQDRREDRRDDRQDRREDRREHRQDRREDRRDDHHGDWRRDWRPGDGHQMRDRDRGRSWYDARQWQRSYHAPRRYRAPRYVTPRGWYVRNWAFGDILPRHWFGAGYYLNWFSYGLPRPPIGTEWVRVGDDALLVDVWSGRIVSVYYDLFW